MPTYNSITDRSEAQALIPEDVSRQIISNMPEQSVVMRMATRLPNLPRNQQRIPVLQSLPVAYFQSSDTSLKQTTEMAWSNKYLNVEEIATIMPISQNVFDDASYSIWDQARPRIVAAMGKLFDQAVLFGTSAPASWPTNIKATANAAGNQISLASYTDLYDAIVGTNGLYAKVEADGYPVTGNVAELGMKARLRGVRATTGEPIFMDFANQSYSVWGVPTFFPMNGSVSSSDALMISGDWAQIVWALRTDISFEVFREGVISDGSGVVVYNLMQQDMIALRVTMRLAWQAPNPINMIQTSEASRYPLAVLTT